MSGKSGTKSDSPIGPVVSAAHLASGAMPALSEIEFAVTMMVNAYHRWMVRCIAASGSEGLGPLDVLVLHTVNHRGRAKTLSDICLVLNIEDTHTVTYAMKKLQKAGADCVRPPRQGENGGDYRSRETACLEYRRLREALLVEPMKALGLDENELSRLAATLRLVSRQL